MVRFLGDGQGDIKRARGGGILSPFILHRGMVSACTAIEGLKNGLYVATYY
jgi:hypothetical protein